MERYHLDKVKETMVERIYRKCEFWVWSGTEMHSESGGDDDDDNDELVRERWDDSDRLVNWLTYWLTDRMSDLGLSTEWYLID